MEFLERAVGLEDFDSVLDEVVDVDVAEAVSPLVVVFHAFSEQEAPGS